MKPASEDAQAVPVAGRVLEPAPLEEVEQALDPPFPKRVLAGLLAIGRREMDRPRRHVLVLALLHAPIEAGRFHARSRAAAPDDQRAYPGPRWRLSRLSSEQESGPDWSACYPDRRPPPAGRLRPAAKPMRCLFPRLLWAADSLRARKAHLSGPANRARDCSLRREAGLATGALARRSEQASRGCGETSAVPAGAAVSALRGPVVSVRSRRHPNFSRCLAAPTPSGDL